MTTPRRLIATLLSTLTALLALLVVAAPARADVEDFSYRSWDARYVFEVDDDGRVSVAVTETLIAEFPEFDQNRGIVRALPLEFQGYRAAPEDIEVHDETGAPVPFEVAEDDTFRAILVGDDGFVHGEQHYVIGYTLHDVVFTVDDGSRDEFYWDLVPLERRQPIGMFTAELVLPAALQDRLTGDGACYSGPAGATERCQLFFADDGSRETVGVEPLALSAGDGVTVAVGFAAGSVTQPAERLPNFALDTLPALLAGGGLAAGGAAAALVLRERRRRRSARGTVVAQYEVPEKLPPLLAAPVLGTATSPLAAEFVHLAVRGALRIEDGEQRGGWFSGRPQPVLRLLDPVRASDPLDARTIRGLFGAKAAPGTAFALPKRSESFGEKMRGIAAAGRKAATQRGYFERVRVPAARVLGITALPLVATAIALLLAGAGRRNGPTVALALVLGAAGVCGAILGLVKHRVHTPLGAEAREHLLGVREFIRVAEADRLRTLQSYSGAERRTDGTANTVLLYERLLPYAMLFGLEKEWGRALEVAYRDDGVSAPLWYPALGVHGLAQLDRTISNFSSAFTSSASYTSSSSGGATGGGFSGGGGGGGFAGGR